MQRLQWLRVRLRNLLIAFVVFNVLSGFVFVQAEARAVTLASNEHGDIQDYDKRIQKMHEHMDKAWHRVHFAELAGTWCVINLAIVGLALAAYVESRRKDT